MFNLGFLSSTRWVSCRRKSGDSALALGGEMVSLEDADKRYGTITCDRKAKRGLSSVAALVEELEAQMRRLRQAENALDAKISLFRCISVYPLSDTEPPTQEALESRAVSAAQQAGSQPFVPEVLELYPCSDKRVAPAVLKRKKRKALDPAKGESCRQ
eukprot:7463928-Pyramimonas_sp.AAC.2